MPTTRQALASELIRVARALFLREGERYIFKPPFGWRFDDRYDVLRGHRLQPGAEVFLKNNQFDRWSETVLVSDGHNTMVIPSHALQETTAEQTELIVPLFARQRLQAEEIPVVKHSCTTHTARELLHIAKTLVATPPFTLEHRNRGYHDSQSDDSIVAISNGKVIGFLDYSLFQGEVYIQMIEVNPKFRRQGIATQLLKELDRLFPDIEINPGMSTQEGSKLLDQYNRRFPKHVDTQGTTPDKDFVLSFVPDYGKHGDRVSLNGDVSWEAIDRAMAEATIDLSDYDLSYPPDKLRFDKAIKTIPERGWTNAAKYLRQYLGIKKNSDFARQAHELISVAKSIIADSQLDVHYFNLIQTKNADDTLALIDQTAAKAGYRFGPVWHGTFSSPFTVFKTKRNTSEGRMGAYFSDNKGYASNVHGSPATKVYACYIKMNKPFDITAVPREDIAAKAGLGQNAIWATKTQGYAGNYATLEYLDKSFNLVPVLKKKGHDGIIFDGGHEGITYVVFKPSSIKAADVTVDNQGNVIPLSQRFNPANNDIRF